MFKAGQLFITSAVPSIIAVFLFLLYVAPKNTEGLSAVMPMLHMAPIYLWSVMHARQMPLWFVALLGLIADVAISLPLGFSALVYCMTVLFIRTQRKYIYKESFTGLWWYFALSIAALQFLYWLGYSFIIGTAAPIGDLFIQWLATCLCYPALHYPLYPFVEKMAELRYRLLHA